MEFSNIQEDDKGGISNQSLNPNSALFAVPSYDEEDEIGNDNPTVVKIIGCGGGGSNAVQRMIKDGVSGVDFVVLNTDRQALKVSSAPNRVAIGQKITGGLGAGGNPQVGENAAREDADKIKALLQGTDMVIITAGMGGGTGTGSAPIVAELAHEAGILTIGVVTTPFEHEGKVRMNNAREGLEKIKDHVDSLIVIPNDLIFEAVKGIGRKLNFREQFMIADNILCAGVRGLTEVITKTGDINVDFADVCTIMRDSGECILGLGRGKGENRILDAVQGAIANPLLKNRQIDGSKKILINVTSNGAISLEEYKEIVDTITESANPSANIIAGLYVDERMEDDDLAVTVIATAFDNEELAEAESVAASEAGNSDSIMDYGEFENLMSGSSRQESYVEEEIPSRTERDSFSSFDQSKSPYFDNVESSSVQETDAVPEIPAAPVRTEPESSRVFRGREVPDTVDLDDKDVPAYLRKKFSRSIDLT